MTWPKRALGSGHASPVDWPAPRDPHVRRILVEHPEPAARELITRGLRERGYEVVSCGGPDAHGGTGTDGCPVLQGESCPGVDGADVVVSSLGLTKARDSMIVRAILEDPASPPVLLEASDWQVATTLGPESDVPHHYPFTSVGQIADAIEHLVPAVGDVPA